MKTCDKRQDILRAALELIAERGFHGAPMAEIAEKAGVGAGTIYRYFENKDVLITELHAELNKKINDTLRCDYPAGGPLRERFLYLFRELFRYFIANPLHFRYMEQYYNSPYGVSAHRERLGGKAGKRDLLMDVFQEGGERGILKEFPKAVLFSLACGSLASLVRAHILGFVALDDALITQITEAAWDGIKR